MVRITTVCFRSRILGFVPGWLALVLVLGGIAAAAPPVFNGLWAIPGGAAANIPGSGTTVQNVQCTGLGLIQSSTQLECMDSSGNIGVLGKIQVAGGICGVTGGGVWEGTPSGGFLGCHNNLISGNPDWYTNGPDDIAIGPNAVPNDTGTGGSNIGIGGGALQGGSGFNGSNDVAVGRHACTSMLTGGADVCIGVNSLDHATANSSNTAVGFEALFNGDPSNTVAIGSSAMLNSTGTMNQETVVGTAAGESINGASYETLVGGSAGQFVTTGASNTCVGYVCLNSVSTGSSNIAMGDHAGYAVNSSQSIFIGMDTALLGSGTPQNDVVMGNVAGEHISGGDNTLIGTDAGQAQTTPTFNTLVGSHEGNSITTGGNNTMIGSELSSAGVCDPTTASKDIVIGYDVCTADRTTSGALAIQNAIYGIGNTGTTTTVSTGCIVLYSVETSCPSGIKLDVVTGGIRAPSGSATSCTGGHTFDNGIMVISGAGAPTCTAPAASMYLRSDGASGTHIYISQGSGTWTAIAGV